MQKEKWSSPEALFGPISPGCKWWKAIEHPVTDTRKKADPDPQQSSESAEDHRVPGGPEHAKNMV